MKENHLDLDLTNDNSKFVCKNNKDHTISNVTDFTRTTKIIRNDDDNILTNMNFYFLIL